MYKRQHLVHALFVDVEIDTFPTIQKYFAKCIPVSNFMQARPFMKLPAESTTYTVRFESYASGVVGHQGSRYLGFAFQLESTLRERQRDVYKRQRFYSVRGYECSS